MNNKFTFDDVLIVPAFSDVERGEIFVGGNMFFDCTLDIPILSSPMDTVSGEQMVLAMNFNGALGVHYRNCSIEVFTSMLDMGCAVAVFPSMEDTFYNAITYANTTPILVLDVAHGNTRRNLDFCEKFVKIGCHVVSGNIADKEAALRYLNIGVNYFRVGIGSGSVCTTRKVCGIGYPQGSAIKEINELRFDHPQLRIISDGGHKTTGDIVKALALGADFVMLGGMLAGADEAEGMTELMSGERFGAYRGMASAASLSLRKKEFFVEGIGKNVPPVGSVKDVLKTIKDAIEQACYYTGSRNLQELRESEIIFLSEGSKIESYVR